ncbi:hypothetical protein K469DRAFT_233413 [Zopfia rhizophila CBS 207.26]|uniref:Uncharacterized protein n=1 Tax=Zopfia rhizophila CBS 207.26 TaxID=1314779 RepID=A0A6A6DVR0_9PEZI|nr:hypothetical protein K469DRAFT_233413 [Zopfia rhizophila CBS 207.26]
MPQKVFLNMLSDYLKLVYPILPLVYQPTFHAHLDSEAYTSDPAFLRLCVSLCGVTVASIPRSIDTYGFGKHVSPGNGGPSMPYGC